MKMRAVYSTFHKNVSIGKCGLSAWWKPSRLKK